VDPQMSVIWGTMCAKNMFFVHRVWYTSAQLGVTMEWTPKWSTSGPLRDTLLAGPGSSARAQGQRCL
jgi:hypothetical protein